MTTTTAEPTNLYTNNWVPSLIFCLGEAYTPQSLSMQRYVYLSIIQPDGFPWLRGQVPLNDVGAPTQIVLTSLKSSYYNPIGSSALPLGVSVIIPFNTTTNLFSDSSVVKIGYAPVSGDKLTAALYVGDSVYLAKPINIS